ncbi:proline-rich receptor-like protein kinase PERK13 [Hevea brasiliensis]|uniref:proline-rich receptor-like protein kinase PERK13 n=1 Tax=Hevea brasiliensis TaxID=3981 RepID=UPI0025F1B66F|nr:proline-rich receptor-like protein kinase PERK13 [Hevea brasiliensis]
MIFHGAHKLVADFGLALLFPETGNLTHITRSNKGTQVYADPEHYPQKVSEKSDVYSYGVVLLELISGKKTKFEDTNIVAWAKPQIQYALRSGDYTNLVDSKILQMNYNEKEMKAMISCAAACMYKPSNSRPKMNQIVRALEGYMCIEEIWNEKNDNIFLKDNPKSNGSHNVEPNGSHKSKPLISSEANGSHNIEFNGSQKLKSLVSSEANNGIEQKEFTHREPLVAINGSSNATNVTERFQDYRQRKINFQEDYQPRRFTYQELTMATGGFSEDNRLDEGPWGQVYKGDLNGEKVKVKKFNNPKKQEEEYTKMKAVASGFRLRGLVNLIGYCEEGANRLLVYEFVPLGKSLRNYFDGKDGCRRVSDDLIRLARTLDDLENKLAKGENELAKENFLSWHMSAHWKDKFFLDDDFELRVIITHIIAPYRQSFAHIWAFYFIYI